MAEKPTVSDLAAELIAAYDVIEAMLPFALRLLKAGEVSLSEQRYFWEPIEQLENYIDVLGNPDNLLDPFATGDNSLSARLMQLKDLWLDAEPEAVAEQAE